MENFFSGFITGILLTLLSTVTVITIYNDKKLKSVGIDRIVSCSVDTTNCHSNWNEIVWIKK